MDEEPAAPGAVTPTYETLAALVAAVPTAAIKRITVYRPGRSGTVYNLFVELRVLRPADDAGRITYPVRFRYTDDRWRLTRNQRVWEHAVACRAWEHDNGPLAPVS